MIERRRFVASAGCLAAATVCGCASQGTTPAATVAGASPACQTFNKSRQAAITPEEALAMLKQGNQRFTSGTPVNCDLMAQVRATSEGQAPFAAVIGCIDSRVAPELVFDQRIGDMFVARVAGNFVNTDIIGSLEFATALAGAKLIVVLGHSECGAIKGAVDNAQFGNLTAMLANIRPSVLKVRDIPGSQDSKNKRLVQAVAEQNAVDAVAALLARSDVLRTLVAQGKLKVVSAMHDVGTGKVSWAA
ncbi:carbonic anhydrase [Caenimonas koreensis DSM 17982]|uniref:carbonic anhydrase n=1 Tax=Caenimonas koreensis DSM 17982 TaxID=1121255 RepID=A0A844B3G1_9BURK|nr:carbonic anhydrase family protein [Caenimonas koreensis]MRD49308.1 carbonic anhydrase [Caenimonas koreensis DSM 17982]